MSTAEVTMYRVVCDYTDCGASPDDEYYAWADADQAGWAAQEDGAWLILDGDLHYCQKHTVYDAEQDEYVPMPEPAEVKS